MSNKRPIKIKEIASQDSVFEIALSILLFIILLTNIKNIYTVWEIFDEACYLFNASIFSKVNWKETFAYCESYYGWGYSMFLVPLFWFCKNSLQLIRGAIVINYLFVVLCYYQLNRLLRKVSGVIHDKLISVISFVLCFFPYVYLNANKINCEVCVLAFFLLICNCVFELLLSQSWKQFITLGILTSLVYAVHARTIVILLVTWCFVGAFCVLKKTSGHRLLLGIAITVIMFVIVKHIKSYFLGFYNQKSLFETVETTNNLFSTSFFQDRINWFLSAIPLYLFGLVVKYVYLIVCSCGLITFGVLDCLNSIKRLVIKKNYTVMDLFFVFVLLVFGAMIVACILTGLGDDFRYLIYGRYFEYTAIPLIAIGIWGLSKGKFSKNTVLIVTVVNLLLIIASWRITDTYPSNSLRADTNRLAGITGITSLTSEYIAVLLLGVILTIIACSCISSSVKARATCLTMCILLLGVFVFSDSKGIKIINKANEVGERDWKVLDKYISDENEVFFVADESSEYWSFYTQLQVMIYDKEMFIISYDDIEEVESDHYIITMTSGDIFNELNGSNYILVDQGHHFALFEMRERGID